MEKARGGDEYMGQIINDTKKLLRVTFEHEVDFKKLKK